MLPQQAPGRDVMADGDAGCCPDPAKAGYLQIVQSHTQNGMLMACAALAQGIISNMHAMCCAR